MSFPKRPYILFHDICLNNIAQAESECVYNKASQRAKAVFNAKRFMMLYLHILYVHYFLMFLRANAKDLIIYFCITAMYLQRDLTLDVYPI